LVREIGANDVSQFDGRFVSLRGSEVELVSLVLVFELFDLFLRVLECFIDFAADGVEVFLCSELFVVVFSFGAQFYFAQHQSCLFDLMIESADHD